MVTTLWFIWFARCQNTFNHNVIPYASIINSIFKFVNDQRILTKWVSSSHPLNRELSTVDFLIRTDGSFISNDQLAACRCGLDYK